MVIRDCIQARLLENNVQIYCDDVIMRFDEVYGRSMCSFEQEGTTVVYCALQHVAEIRVGPSREVLYLENPSPKNAFRTRGDEKW